MKTTFLFITALSCVYGTCFAVEEKLTTEELRSQYRLARPKLEAIWKVPVKYHFNLAVSRWDIPTNMVGKIRPTDSLQFDVFGQDGRWRIDTIQTQEGGSKSVNVMVSSNDEPFSVRKVSGEQVFTKIDFAGNTRPFQESQKAIAGLCEVAFMLPTRFDVSRILFGNNYQIAVLSVIDSLTPSEKSSKSRLVTCEFARIPKSNPSIPPKELFYESGQIVFLADQDWAIDSFRIKTNTDVLYDGHVEYQKVAGIGSQTAPKRVEFRTSEKKSSLKTLDVLEATSIIPGPINDRVFSLSEFQIKKLETKQSEGWNLTAVFVGLGVFLVLIAIVVRLVAYRQSKSDT